MEDVIVKIAGQEIPAKAIKVKKATAIVAFGEDIVELPCKVVYHACESGCGQMVTINNSRCDTCSDTEPEFGRYE